ncbi:ead/Ea22-like family protein [Klebsiella variicola subsp. variicola]|uniref:ead/Ea22-like family protein n=1 Tax=Klebsiella pneumoniae complex TaxID=3390273 RepID=UPI00164A1ABF|nr:ead/Ea22-like family protein [Klebsiella pneumoniae]HBR3171097.1 ead/Ea22-like family protein [Klebsiella pneumoniae]HDU5656970.1 ead/Ea22-like family protein [Klebsiella pneumoniae subsp. pneumoniae]
MTTDITELAQSLKAAAEKATPGPWEVQFGEEIYATDGVDNEQVAIATLDARDADYIALANPANVLALIEALEKVQQRNAELEAQNDYFASLVAMARVSADKAIRKFPQPNYVLLKVAEEAGEVVQAGVHYAENRMEWGQVEGEIVQLLAMLIRLVTEGDQVNGITPPASCSTGIKVEAE